MELARGNGETVSRREDMPPADEAPEALPEPREDIPRRRRASRPEPEMPSGYRASKRRSKAAKRARKAKREHVVVERITNSVDTVGRYAWLTGRVTLIGAGAAVLAASLLWATVLGINAGARWWAKRQAAHEASPAGRAEASRDNLLVIGVDGGKAHGFLALRVDTREEQVWGLAIPATVFAEVPGVGFERIGESLRGGDDDALVAVSNFLGVPFEQYVVVDKETYQAALGSQSVSGLVDSAVRTNLAAGAVSRLKPVMDTAAGSRIGLAPLPVKPISLGDQEYLEAETEKVADLIEKWWGTRPATHGGVRVIVYNGAGTPGIAGAAAKALVKSGMRIVGTGNADRFDYKKTVIAIHSGQPAHGETVREALGVGEIVAQGSEQQIADVIVIIGKDYVPPPGG